MGLLTLAIKDDQGQPVQVKSLTATLGRATHVYEDTTPDFRFDGETYFAAAQLGDGNWNIRMVAVSEDGTEFQQTCCSDKGMTNQ